MKKIEQINLMRRSLGLPALIAAYRKCLSCDRKFWSYNNTNRICKRCKERVDHK